MALDKDVSLMYKAEYRQFKRVCCSVQGCQEVQEQHLLLWDELSAVHVPPKHLVCSPGSAATTRHDQ